MSRIGFVLVLFALTPLVACDSSLSEPGRATGPEYPAAAAPVAAGNALAKSNAQIAAIHELQSAFHGALRNSDYSAMHALWASDATAIAGAIGCTPDEPCTGPDAIADAFATSGPFVNGWAALAPTYKTRVEINGGTAEFGFECVYVAESGNLGGQVVIAHLNATGTMRQVRGQWLFQSFVGGVGPIP